jgi:uncharacterized protein (DUF342 family)
MALSACRVLRVHLTTLPTLMQQANAHWEQVSQVLQADERHLERLQHRLSVLQQILAGEPTLPPAHSPALVAKVQALASAAEDLQERIAQERVRCQMLQQVFEEAQRAQSILLKQRERTHPRGRHHFQQLLKDLFTQIPQAALSFPLMLPGEMMPPF